MSNKKHSATFLRSIKKDYFKRAILLLIILPIDIIIIFISNLFKKNKSDYIFATYKWMDLAEILSKKNNVTLIAPINYLPFCIKSKIQYYPASVFYILSSIGLIIKRQKSQEKYSNRVISFSKFIISKILHKNSKLIVHSDALPFGRLLVLSMNQLKKHTICLQHGLFHTFDIINERDGSFCTVNTVYSDFDGEIIKNANKCTIIDIRPMLFLSKLDFCPSPCTKTNIMLIGEGMDLIDKDFQKKYLNTLINIEKELVSMSVNVIFRPHPYDKVKYMKNLFNNVSTDSLDETLKNIHAVIGFSSSLLYECAELGIPSFHIKNERFDYYPIRNNKKVHRLDNLNFLILSANNYKKSVNEKTDRYEVNKINFNKERRKFELKDYECFLECL